MKARKLQGIRTGQGEVRALLGLLCAIASLSGCAKDTTPERTAIACEVLADFVQREFSGSSRPLAINDDPLPLELKADLSVDQLLIMMNQDNPNPLSRDEMQSWLEEEQRLAVLSPTATCPEVARISAERGIERPAFDPPVTTEDGLFYEFDTLAIRLPNVDLQRGIATFEVSRVCGPLCAGGVSVTYKRSASGDWQYEKEVGLWIS